MISRCPSCGAQVDDEATRCASCQWDFIAFKRITDVAPPAVKGETPQLPPAVIAQEPAPVEAEPEKPVRAAPRAPMKVQPNDSLPGFAIPTLGKAPSGPPPEIGLQAHEQPAKLGEIKAEEKAKVAAKEKPKAPATPAPVAAPAPIPVPARAQKIPPPPLPEAKTAPPKTAPPKTAPTTNTALPRPRVTMNHWLIGGAVVVGVGFLVTIALVMRPAAPEGRQGPVRSPFPKGSDTLRMPPPAEKAPQAVEPVIAVPIPATPVPSVAPAPIVAPAVAPAPVVAPVPAPVAAPTPVIPAKPLAAPQAPAPAAVAPTFTRTTVATESPKPTERPNPMDPPKPPEAPPAPAQPKAVEPAKTKPVEPAKALKAAPAVMWVFEGSVYDLISLEAVYTATLAFKDPGGKLRGETTTGDGGRFKLSVEALAGGKGYVVEVSHPDYQPKYIDEITPPFREVEAVQRRALADSAARNRPWVGVPGSALQRDFVMIPKVLPEAP